MIGSGLTMGNIRRVVVGLKSRDSSGVILASFIDCIVNYFNPNCLSAQLCCNLEDNILILGPPPSDAEKLQDCADSTNKAGFVQSSTVTIEHSLACPLWHLRKDPNSPLPEKHERGVQVGVATILESSDEHILITQRADQMRTFPRTWVPPGGHVEVGETLIGGAMRELEEETGLDLNVLPHRTQLLCLWESVYPPFLGMGEPSNHHVVVYIHTKVDTTWQELQTKLKLDTEEVQSCVWLSLQNIKSICSGTSDAVLVDKYVVGQDLRLVSEPFDLSRLFPVYVPGRNYSGLQLALNKWLDMKASNTEHPSKSKM